MGRKGSKKQALKFEREHLLKEVASSDDAGTNALQVPSPSKRERRKSVWAPAATATKFEDVPVYTICPYCNQKVVTKTHFKRGRKNWYCCFCLPYFLDVFKDVIHSCPKCNRQISIYNRFRLGFFKRDNMSNTSAENGNHNNNAIDVNEEIK
ncbi:cell death-inducing p53-target protein 1-like [Hydractinia symbiolongicarpus]|uniref:cell death-inducing p53-target protein 1-like n=1 Tax=Hydractinia symbiolongicarpus TaxID=13093 RepID=UPI00254EEA3E|nr:cell death-inducing p53-target protein 1-like [Hydractinia symbiolongicarpus]XP_057300633.1 cell death-inducing p53-target protein 1-like [Hydractinia symbiolongicarpus]